MTIQDMITALIDTHNVRQKDIANIAGVSQPTVSRLYKYGAKPDAVRYATYTRVKALLDYHEYHDRRTVNE